MTAQVVTITEETISNVKKITWDWTATDAGAVVGAVTTGTYTGTISAYTVPDTGTAPSPNYDITLKDASGIDVANSLLLNRHTSNTEWVGDTSTGKVVNSTLTMAVASAGNAGKGKLYVYVSPVGMVSATTTESQIYVAQPRLAAAANASPLTSGTLWTYTGSIEIIHLIGRVTTAIQDQATTVLLSVVGDALSAYNICTAVSIRNFAIGSLISITGTAGAAAVSTTAVPAIAPGQVASVVATCTTSGVITNTFSAASTGAISWYMLWRPLSSGATVV